MENGCLNKLMPVTELFKCVFTNVNQTFDYRNGEEMTRYLGLLKIPF